MRRVWLAMIIASLGWGTAGVATRVALDEGVTPYRLASYRSLLAVVAVLLYLVVARRGLPTGEVVWKVGLAMGLSNLAMPFIFSNLALQRASAGFLGLMTALIPLITAAVAHFALADERLSVVKTLGLLIGFSGVAVLMLSGDSGLAEGGSPLTAGLLGLGAVVSISVGSIYAKHHAGAYEPIDVTGVSFGFGVVIIAVTTLVVEGGPAAETGAAWAVLVYMALASTVLPMLLYYWMLRKISATYASLMGYVIPVIAVTAGIVLLDEQLQPGIVWGGLLILIGVLVTDRAERRPGIRAVVPD
ncbi:MAG: DMT family transporter [Acidimicrobiia bacterium]